MKSCGDCSKDGKFSPEDWLADYWNVEEKAGRLGMRRKMEQKMKMDNMLMLEPGSAESTVLSPQRRGFSSGCRPPSPKASANCGRGTAAFCDIESSTAEDSSDRASASKNWRSTAASSSAKPFTNGLDFKPSFVSRTHVPLLSAICFAAEDRGVWQQ